jgi:hypothetical protein
MRQDKTKVIPLKDMPTGGSDITLKQDVAPIKGGLKKVMALRPVSWRWKAAKKSDRPRYGFIAQELEEILPDLVTEEAWQGDGTVKGDGSMRKHIAANDITPYLVSAIQEMQAQLDNLEKQLNNNPKK